MSIRQERINKGLCPNDGNEAAPYRLCRYCMQIQWISRVLKKAERVGRFKSVIDPTDRRRRLWDIGPNPDAKVKYIRSAFDREDWTTDKRTRPRFGKVPVNVEAELVDIFLRAARPLLTDEVIAAWGKLRTARKHAALSGDLEALITAERRREERNRKRLKHTGTTSALG